MSSSRFRKSVNFVLLRHLVLPQRIHELLALNEDGFGKVRFFFGLLGFRLRLERRFEQDLAICPGLLDHVLEKGQTAGLNCSERGLLLHLVHELDAAADQGVA